MSLRLTCKKLALEIIAFSLTMSFGFFIRRELFSLFMGPVGKSTTLHGFIKFFDFGNISIGENCTINRYCYLDNRGGISIGQNVNISHDCRIYTMGHDVNDPRARVVSSPVVIRDNVWIFPGVRIMPGVTIGEGAVIYPGSVVTKSVDAFTIVAGVPARRVADRNRIIDYSASFPVHFSI